jgi:hypothetical protein
VKNWVIFLICAAVVLAGCQGKNATQAEQFAATQVPTQAQTAAPATQAPPPGCTVVSPPPTPGPTAQSLFPMVSAQDWVAGPDDAALTFIEYSDFQ